jgi:hypothetical protein
VGGQFRCVLAPGVYRLAVTGREVAAQAVPFSIRAGEETVVEVPVQRGVLQQFAIVSPDGVDASRVQVWVRRGSDSVGHPRAVSGEQGVWELCLPPGGYTVTVKAGERSGQAAFTVGASAGEPVRIELR